MAKLVSLHQMTGELTRLRLNHKGASYSLRMAEYRSPSEYQGILLKYQNPMNSKNLTKAERDYLGILKLLPCSVCGATGPSDAHHIKQGSTFTCVALCKDCHQGPFLGWHGQKRAWIVRKMDELDALNITLERMFKLMPVAHPECN